MAVCTCGGGYFDADSYEGHSLALCVSWEAPSFNARLPEKLRIRHAELMRERQVRRVNKLRREADELEASLRGI